ncbi:hypothetical protein Tco_1415537 [Tanacetum coccineum]
MKYDNVISPGMFRINPSKTFRGHNFMPINQARASVRTNPITVSQPHVITKKDVNFDSNALSSTGVIQIYLWCVDSGCSKHMTGNLKLLINFVWKFLGMVHFGNVHIAAILDLEVSFRRNTCFVINLDGVNLLKENHTTNLYTINLQEMASASPICLIARATSTKSKDEAPEEIKTFLKKIQVLLHDLVINQLLLRATLKTAPSFTDDLAKLHMSLLTEENWISPFFMTRKIMKMMNVTFDELSTIAFEQRSLKPGLQGFTSGQISLGLDLTYAPSTITSQKPTERELDLLFEAMYDDYIGGQLSVAPRTTSATPAPQVLQTPTVSITTARGVKWVDPTRPETDKAL